VNRAQLEEKVLEAIAVEMGDACAGFDFDNCPDDNAGTCYCKSQRDAVLRFIDQSDLVIVPKEPTTVMDDAATACGDMVARYERWRSMYRAAIAASPLVKKDAD